MERYAWILALVALFVFKYSELRRPLPESPLPVSQPRPDEILVWNALVLNITEDEKLPMPLAARAAAIMHVAMFDVLNAIQPRYTPFAFSGRFAPQTSTDAALASAAHQVLFELFPAHRERLEQELKLSLARVPEGMSKTEGIRAGVAVGHGTVGARQNDLSLASQPPPANARKKGAPGFWVPASMENETTFPNWGSVPPFGVSDIVMFRLAGPPSLKSKAWAQEVNEVQSLGGANSKTRTADQTAIAQFWNTDLIARWNLVMQEIAMQRPQELHERARWFALLNTALVDTTVVSWDMKAHFFFWDPTTAIQFSEFTGHRPGPRDTRWQPLLPRESSPNYVSEHAAISAAAATLLALLTETDNFPLKIVNHADTTVTRSYPSFSAAALEAAQSRLYGGTHFPSSIKDGLTAGKTVSLSVFEHRARTQSLTLAPAR